MKPITRRVIILTTCLALLCVIGGRAAFGEGGPGRTKNDVVRLLRGGSVGWQANIVDCLLDAMPDRMINHLSLQTRGSVTAYLARASSIPLHPRNTRAGFYVVSSSTGGSFVAITTTTYQGPVVVWDTLMPPSLLFPQIAFANIDDDSTYEAICSGQILNSPLMEWAVIDWDSTGGRLLAPRLDQPASHIMANRLIGREIRLLDDSSSVYKKLEIFGALPVGIAPEHADTTALGVRVFRFDPSVGGYLPSE